MAVEKEQLVNDSEAASSRPIQLITENGFSIVRAGDLGGDGAADARQHSFLVRDRDGYELDIAVEFDPTVVLEAITRSEGRISGDSSYWICCAERHLADYLWEEDDYPPAATLKVAQLSPDDLDLARRWEVDISF
jgi:hypothetical protein